MIRLACMTPARRATFTPVEIEIIKALGRGKTPKEIAWHRRCSESSVSQTLKGARRLVKAKTNFELLAYALREGIIG